MPYISDKQNLQKTIFLWNEQNLSGIQFKNAFKKNANTHGISHLSPASSVYKRAPTTQIHKTSVHFENKSIAAMNEEKKKR